MYIYIERDGVGSYLECNKYGEDVCDKEKSFMKDKDSNDPGDAHNEE